MQLPDDVVYFLERQGGITVSTIDSKKRIHCSVKGIVGIEPAGKIFVIDLYRRTTFKNLQQDPTVSLTAVDEHNFIGYTLQGRGKIVPREEIHEHLIKKWEDRIIRRISNRLIKGVQSKSQSPAHFEAKLPTRPQYLIEIDIDNIIDLAPPSMQKGKT